MSSIKPTQPGTTHRRKDRSNQGEALADQRTSILVIENDLLTVKLYRRVLERDYKVIVLSDKSSVLDIISNGGLHAIILEPALDNGRGWTLFTAIQKAVREHPVPVIVCTMLDARKRGMEMGAAAVLMKPVSPNRLIETLRQVQYSNSR
ncbi:MAG: response regulator [Anaerolineae bacterium]|nr:response regulator [Anaerolineae bacterium]